MQRQIFNHFQLLMQRKSEKFSFISCEGATSTIVHIDVNLIVHCLNSLHWYLYGCNRCGTGEREVIRLETILHDGSDRQNVRNFLCEGIVRSQR